MLIYVNKFECLFDDREIAKAEKVHFQETDSVLAYCVHIVLGYNFVAICFALKRGVFG